MKTSVSDLMLKVGMWFGDRRVVLGMPVIALADGNETALLTRVEAALHLIADVHPRQFRRLRRDLAAIWIRRYVLWRASYSSRWNVCTLDAGFVVDPTTQTAQIAASIIHEAAHARIHHAGIAYEGPAMDRIERLCRTAELAFGERCPDGQIVVERAADHLALPVGSLIQSPAELERTWRAARRTMLQELPVPEWIRKWLLRVTERRTA